MKALQQGSPSLTDMLVEEIKLYLEDKSELMVKDHNFTINALLSSTINNLHETVKLMVDLGFEKECSDMYTSCRRENLKEFLMNKLFSLQDIEGKRENMGILQFHEYLIKKWIEALKVSLRIVFPLERWLCYRIFSGVSSTADLCFTEVCREAMIQLLKFADAVASGSPLEWRLFKLLDMFETVRVLIPEFQSLFPEMLVNEAIKTQNRLGEASRDIFLELGKLIFLVPESKVVAPTHCGLHPTTYYVMDYFDFACRSRQILEQILQEYPKFVDGARTPSLSTQINRIMELLERKLVAKSKDYKDPTMRYFFMMHNWRYIEQGAKERELCLDCFQKTTEKVQQNLRLYEKSSWNKVLDFLKLDRDVAAETMEEKLRLFNMHFEEICNIQSTWIIFDQQLRKDIIISVQNIILPAYGNLIGRFHEVLGPHAYEHVKFGMLDIHDQLNHLFLGSIQESPELKGKKKLLKQKLM